MAQRLVKLPINTLGVEVIYNGTSYLSVWCYIYTTLNLEMIFNLLVAFVPDDIMIELIGDELQKLKQKVYIIYLLII
jgi:hypothetical protein